MTDFIQYDGDVGDLPTNENHLHFKWDRDDCQVLFSAARQGNGVSSHFSSDKRGLRLIKDAIEDWVAFCGRNFLWADMILGKVNKKSVKRILLRCGFECVYTEGDKSYLMRRIKWDS